MMAAHVLCFDPALGRFAEEARPADELLPVPSWPDPEEEWPVRPEAGSLQRWLDLSA
jgi:hypothetical protein